ncbi:MAG: protein-L-isoaspartate O-methyltransferase [Maricaulis sp.]|nr:protein-L-isoaspartate O-methyltransferase [Maricaulis sp.]HAQ34251.1 protein-L-isoaspartate O-methyltransferase [Alphaproteobacteria bacterium]
MSQFEQERRMMVDGQIRIADVTNRRLQQALLSVPRELFMPRAKRAQAYADVEVEFAPGRWMMRPRDFAKLVHAADVQPSDLVLDLACGRGYSSAILGRMAETVVAMESEARLVEKSETALSKTGSDNVAVIQGDLKTGSQSQGPFNVIFVNGAVEDVPRAWLDQLADGGRLAVVVRRGPIGKATLYHRSGLGIGERVIFDCTPHILPGFEREAGFVF